MLLGDCLEQMRSLPDNSISSIVTDPPYGLSFMGKKWDYDVPSVDIWRECLRVLKPGGHLLSFGGTRTYHRLACNIEDAGFEIRDQIQWLYGSGFPKSHNIKEGEFKGWGTALKPANEPICVARKPLEKGLTVAENVLKWGCGAINVDASRIGFASDADKAKVMDPVDGSKGYKHHAAAMTGGIKRMDAGNPNGRWPANIILDETAAEMLDAQSGVLKTGGDPRKTKQKSTGIYGMGASIPEGPGFAGDSGGASRFFYVAKASKSERNAGLEGMPEKKNDFQRISSGLSTTMKGGRPNQNHHPTVKPIKLMEYLIRLVTPPKGIVLDPFMGSGTTGIAAKNLSFDFIGIEMNAEYFEIAEKRINQ